MSVVMEDEMVVMMMMATMVMVIVVVVMEVVVVVLKVMCVVSREVQVAAGASGRVQTEHHQQTEPSHVSRVGRGSARS